MTTKLPDLEARYPFIPWRDPLRVGWVGSYAAQPDLCSSAEITYACRICIATSGLKKSSVWQWPTLEQAQAHIDGEHIKKP